MDNVHYSFFYIDIMEGDALAKIDVLMATYNGEKYISKQLESILNQTFKDINIIIFDDGSSDNTVNIIEKYQNLDNRIKLYKNEKNVGYNNNFMSLIKKSSAEYFSIADQDDIWHSHQIEILYDNILKTNTDIVYGQSGYINEMDNRVKHREYIQHKKISKTYQLFEDNIVPGRNMLVNSRIKKQLYPVPNLSREFIYDWYLTLKAVENNGIFYIDDEINLYRVHTNSVTNTDVYTPLKKKSFRQKLYYIETLRQNAIKSRINRIDIFKTFIADECEVANYEKYIISLQKCKFINLHLSSFLRYMGIRTLHYKLIFFIILHFPILYRVFIWDMLKRDGMLNEN